MDTHEHAQLIYAHLLSGWAASARPLPGANDQGLIDLAWMYAKQFEQSSNKVKADI